MEKPKDNLVLLPIEDDQTISFKLWFKVGSQNDPKGKEGIAALTADLIAEGSTQTNSYETILDKLYPIAAGYDAKVDKEMTVISGRTHKDNLNEYYTLLTDAILKPAFKQEDFDRIKSNYLNYIEKQLRYASDEELGKAALYGSIFEGTTYNHLTVGSVESIKSITIDDIKKFYKQYYTNKNLLIGISGGFEKTLPEKMEKDLSSLPDTIPQQIDKPKTAPISGYNFLLIEKPCDATAISFGFPINVMRGQDDFFALTLFNSWFGEHRNSSSHLYQVIRELRGMNYGDYSYIETFLHGGYYNVPDPNNARRQQIFEVWLRPVKNENRHFVLRAALRELKNVVDNGMKKEELELTKKFLNKYALNFATTNIKRLGYAIDSKFYGIDSQGDYIELFRRKINEVTLEQVNAAIKKHIQYKNIKFAVVTRDAEQYKKDLIANTPSPIIYATPKSDAVMAEDKLIESFPLDIKPDNIKIVQVEEMFQK